MSVCLYVCLSVRLSVCLFVCLCHFWNSSVLSSPSQSDYSSRLTDQSEDSISSAVQFRLSKCNVLSLSTPFHFRSHNSIKWLFCSVLCFRYINRKWNVCHFPLIFHSDNIISNEDWSNMYWLTTRIIGYSLTAYSNTILSQFLRTFEVLVFPLHYLLRNSYETFEDPGSNFTITHFKTFCLI